MGLIEIVLFFYKDSVGIKSPAKMDVPLNKDMKPNL